MVTMVDVLDKQSTNQLKRGGQYASTVMCVYM